MRSIGRDPYPLAAIVGAAGLCAAVVGVVIDARDSFTYDFPAQIAVLLPLILALSIALSLTKKVQARVIELAAMTILVQIVVSGVGNSVMIPVLLGTAVIAHICLYLPSRGAIVVAAGVAVLICFLARPEVAWGASQPPLSYPVRISMFLVFSIQIAGLTSVSRNRVFRSRAIEDTDRLNTALERLTVANIDYQEYATSIRRLSIHEERNRVSREVHDTVGHTLTNIGMMAEAAYRIVDTDNDRSRRLLDRIRVQAADGLTETRAALRKLRDTKDAPVTGTGRIHKLVESFRAATGVTVNLELGNLVDSLPMEVFDVLYRIIQEGMTNSFRHGEASEILIILHITSDRILHTVVRDNGKGGEDFNEGIGFRGMQERLDRFGGTLEAGNWAYGFEVKAWFKLPDPEDLGD